MVEDITLCPMVVIEGKERCINCYSIPTYKLPKPRIVCNIDGTKNNMGPMTHATNLKVRHNNDIIQINFLIANLGGNSTLLGMPFLATFNPEITVIGQMVPSQET